MTLYCIGKASRYQPMDTVKAVPYEKAVPETMYDVLRSALYPSAENAEMAAAFCTQTNPVGFVVLQVQADD